MHTSAGDFPGAAILPAVGAGNWPAVLHRSSLFLAAELSFQPLPPLPVHHCSAKVLVQTPSMNLFKSSWLLLSATPKPKRAFICNSAMILSSLHACKPVGFHLISRGAKTKHLRSKQ